MACSRMLCSSGRRALLERLRLSTASGGCVSRMAWAEKDLRPGAARPPLSSRGLHLSPQRRIHPVLIMLAKPVSRIAALIVGRKFRIWYQNLPEEEQRKFKNKLRKNQHVIAGLAVAGVAFAAALYESHLEECPITGRRRFVALREDQIQKIAFKEFEGLLEMYDESLLPEGDLAYSRVARVANRILKSNRDLDQVHGKRWTITVVKNDTKNAFVLPGGNIFVFTGMLNVCDNDDQLGIVLSHEVSHCLLGHVAEKLSYVNFLNLLILVPLAVIWAVVPSDGLAIVADWFFKRVVDVVFELPFSRNMETEADEVGLVLASKACLDVREASEFWGRMAVLEKEEQEVLPEFASTHPSHETREAHLRELLPSALKLRLDCGCSRLGPESGIFKAAKGSFPEIIAAPAK